MERNGKKASGALDCGLAKTTAVLDGVNMQPNLLMLKRSYVKISFVDDVIGRTLVPQLTAPYSLNAVLFLFSFFLFSLPLLRVNVLRFAFSSPLRLRYTEKNLLKCWGG